MSIFRLFPFQYLFFEAQNYHIRVKGASLCEVQFELDRAFPLGELDFSPLSLGVHYSSLVSLTPSTCEN